MKLMIKSFERMFEILSLFTMERTSLSISEIEKETGYPKSTIFRILNSLIEGEFIEQDPDTHRYLIGMQFFRLGSIFQSQLDLRNVSLPFMKKLSKDSQETIELNIVDGTNRFCIEKIDSPLAVRNFVQVGDRHPLHLGASGKSLLAFMDKKEQDSVISKLSEEYEIDIPELRQDLLDIKEKGYAFTKGERVIGSFAVSAPILDGEGSLMATITLAGPIQRLSEERESELIKLLTAAAKKISEKFGYFSVKNTR